MQSKTADKQDFNAGKEFEKQVNTLVKSKVKLWRGCVVAWRLGSTDSDKIHRSLLESPWILERIIGAYWNLVGALSDVVKQYKTLCTRVNYFAKPLLFNYVFAVLSLTRVEQ